MLKPSRLFGPAWTYSLKPRLKSGLLRVLSLMKRAGTKGSGVNVIGFFSAESGLGQSARALIAALDAAGIPVALIDVPYTPSRRQDETFALRCAHTAPYATTILVLNPESMPRFLLMGGWKYIQARHLIAYWTWELPMIPSDWDGALQLVDEVWVPSMFVAQAVSSRAKKPVHVVPHALTGIDVGMNDRQVFGLPDDRFIFLCVMDFFSGFERKNPRAVLEAFRRAFPQDNLAMLVVKIANLPYDHPLRAELIAMHQVGVVFIDGYLSPAQTQDLIASCDAVISLHRAEGFGFVLAEAMVKGKPVIATGYSGNLQFMSEQNSLLVPAAVTTFQRRFAHYPKGSQWAEPDLDTAAESMRKLVDDPELAKRIGSRASDDMRHMLSPQAIGEIAAGLIAD